MKKEIFHYLYSFKYKDKEYIYLSSSKYPFYFLEYNKITNSFDYPDYQTFQELFNKYYFDKCLIAYEEKSPLNKLKEKLYNLKFEINPLIRTTSGLLSLIMVISMCSCNQAKNTPDNNNTESSMVAELPSEIDEIMTYFKEHQMDIRVKEYDKNYYFFVKEFINSNNKHQLTLESFEEFRKYNNLDFIPSYNDVINAFKENQKIDSEKKSIIIEYLNNMKDTKELSKMDLSVLYINAKRMNFQYLSEEEMYKRVNRKSVYAYFDVIDGTVYLPKDKPLKIFEFIHEVLGHGSLAYRNETKDSLIVFDCTNYLMLRTDNNYTGYSMGTTYSEGGANLIAHLLTKEYDTSTFYELYEEELRVIAELCHLSIGELFNYKGINFYDLMYSNGIDTPIEYIFKMDGIFKGQLYCEFSDLMERLFIDATEEQILQSSPSIQEKIINSTINIIRNSYFKEKDNLHYEYSGGSIDYDFEDSVSKYKENVNKLRGNK